MITLSLALNMASIACGLASAVFWFRSTRIAWPAAKFDGGKRQIDAMNRQSFYSGWGAVLAAAAMILLAVDNIVKMWQTIQ